MKRISFAGWCLIGLVLAGIFYVSGCEAHVPLRPEVAEAVGLPPLTADKKPVEVPLSAYPGVEAIYEKKQLAKADEKRAEAVAVAAAAEVKIVKATRNVAREIRTLQERLEDDTEAVRAQAGLAAKDAEAAIARINAETANTKAMQAIDLQRAREKQAMYDELKALGGGAFNTVGGIATAASAGTPWGAIVPYGLAGLAALFGFNRNSVAKAKTEEAKKNAEALDATVHAIEKASVLPLQPLTAINSDGKPKTLDTVGAIVKNMVRNESEPGDDAAIKASLGRGGFATT